MTRASYFLFVLMLIGLGISLFLYRKSKESVTRFNERMNIVKEVLFLLERTEKLTNILRETVYEGSDKKDTASAYVFSSRHKYQVDSILNRLHSIVLYDDQRLRIDTIQGIIDNNFQLLKHDSIDIRYYAGVSSIIPRAQTYAQNRLKEHQQAFEDQERNLALFTNTIIAVSLCLFGIAIWSIAYENSAKKKLKTVHESVKESEERFRLLATSIPQIIWIADAKGNIEYLSDQWEKYTGLKTSEGMKQFSSLIHKDDIDRVRAKWYTAMAERKPWEAEYRLKDLRTNSYTWFSGCAVPLKDDKGNVVKWIGSSSDITPQRELNETLSALVNERTNELSLSNKSLELKNAELSRAQSFLQTVLDTSVEMVTAFDKDLNFTFINKRANDFVEMNIEDQIGKNITDVHPGFEKTDGYQYLQRALKGEVIHIDAGKPFVNQDLILETFVLPLKHNGQITGVLTLQRDITAMIKLTEDLKESNFELKRSNEDLQQFAHVTSHDLKEPVRKIMMYIDLLKTNYEELLPEPGRNYLTKVERSGDRISSMIDGVLQYSLLQDVDQSFELLDLNTVIKNVLDDLEVVIQEKNACIEVNNLSPVTASSTLMNQLFYNLINNSLKFTRETIKPMIKIESTVIGGTEIAGLSESIHPHRTYTKIDIIDNGMGFDQAYAERIFEPFSRLNPKEKFEGTGLGLALCKKIVERHHGFITAYAEVNQGAKFSIYLPLS